MDLDYKLDRFNVLVDNYVNTVNSLLDLAVESKIVPFKVIMGLPFIKDYIKTNRIDIMEYSIQYILSNKDNIINFDISKLDELDELDESIDSDDNVSRKQYINNISNVKSNINLKITNNFNSDDILDLIIQIKNNSKNLDKFTIQMIRNYIELLIFILEQIKVLF